VIAANYSHLSHGEALLDAAAEENVLFSLENLHTYPSVQDRFEKGTLHIHGWFFKIATGELFAYDPAQTQFVPLQKPETAA
jgi:carbonic anhydrase